MALAPLAPFLAALVALGLAALLTALVLAMIRFLGTAPLIGSWIAGKAHQAERAISGGLGGALSGIDSFIAGTIHNMARRVEAVAWAIQDAAQAALHAAETLNPVAIAAHVARQVAHAIAQTLHGIEHGIRTIEREFKGIEHGLKRLERDLARGIGHDLRITVKALERDLNHVRRKVIPSIRGDVRTAEGEIGHLYDWAKGKASLLGVGTFAMAVAAALSTLGLGAIRCSNLGNMFKSRGCGLWNGLEDLLGLFVDVLVFTNVCAILDFVSPFVSEVAVPVVVALTDIGAGLCAGSIGAPPALPPVTLYTPPSPGVTLYLP